MEAPSFVITLRGELDLSNVAEMRSSLADAQGPAVVDLSAVTYLDSTALYELGVLRKRVGNVVLVAPSPADPPHAGDRGLHEDLRHRREPGRARHALA